LIQELVKRKITSTNSNFDIVLFNFNGNSLGSELVNALRLTHEHDLEFGSFGVVVDEFSELSVSLILLDWDVYSDSLLEINDVLLQSINLDLSILKLLQKLQGSLVGFVNLLLKLKNVVSGVVELSLKCLLLREKFGISLLGSGELSLNVFFLSDDFLKANDDRLMGNNSLSELLNFDMLEINGAH